MKWSGDTKNCCVATWGTDTCFLPSYYQNDVPFPPTGLSIWEAQVTDGSLKINGAHVAPPGRSIPHWEQIATSTEPIVVGMGGTNVLCGSLKVMVRKTTPTVYVCTSLRRPGLSTVKDFWVRRLACSGNSSKSWDSFCGGQWPQPPDYPSLVSFDCVD